MKSSEFILIEGNRTKFKNKQEFINDIRMVKYLSDIEYGE